MRKKAYRLLLRIIAAILVIPPMFLKWAYFRVFHPRLQIIPAKVEKSPTAHIPVQIIN